MGSFDTDAAKLAGLSKFDVATLTIHTQFGDIDEQLEHHEILNRIESYSLADPATLLPRHQSLYAADFAAFGGGPTSHRLLWLANMETAVATANLVQAGALSESAIAHFSQGTTWVAPHQHKSSKYKYG
jgi:hypothetical protein